MLGLGLPTQGIGAGRRTWGLFGLAEGDTPCERLVAPKANAVVLTVVLATLVDVVLHIIWLADAAVAV